jgi:outer membrane immunogenic protein
MKNWLVCGAALIAAVGASSADAADLTPAPVYKAPAVAAPSSPWSGFYAGLALGFRADRSDATTISQSLAGVPTNLSQGAIQQEPLDGIGFRAAPYIGWNWQVAPQWVVGIEGDVGFANQATALQGFGFGPEFLDSLAGDSLALKTTWDASVRARLGYLVTPSTLLYATGGAAWQHFQVISTCGSASFCVADAVTPAVIANSTTRTGWTIGAGVETALRGHWLLRGEYRYADFGSSSFSLSRSSTDPAFNPTVDSFNVSMRTHTVTFGLAYKFGDPVPSANPGDAPGLFPVKATPAAMSWSGPYLGLGLGERTSRADATTTSLLAGGVSQNLTGQATSEPFDGTAFRAAPYFGWNWQVAPQWLVGVEGDVGFANQTTALQGFDFGPHGFQSSGAGADSLAVRTTWDASARARLGYLVTPATLLYATGGAAWQHFEVTSTCVGFFCALVNFTPSIITNSTTRSGWTVGAGFETALSRNWFARAEYRYADFGSRPFSLSRSSAEGAFNPTVDNFNVAMRTHTATLGVAYKFDWGTGPVVAKY